MHRKHVYEFIDGERDHQDAKWGTPFEHPHEVGGWLTVMRYLLTEAEREWSTTNGDFGALEQVRKLTAVGVACMEQHGVPPRVAGLRRSA